MYVLSTTQSSVNYTDRNIWNPFCISLKHPFTRSVLMLLHLLWKVLPEHSSSPIALLKLLATSFLFIFLLSFTCCILFSLNYIMCSVYTPEKLLCFGLCPRYRAISNRKLLFYKFKTDCWHSKNRFSKRTTEKFFLHGRHFGNENCKSPEKWRFVLFFMFLTIGFDRTCC